MKHDSELTHVTLAPPASVVGTACDASIAMPAADEPRPLARIHSLLRGRYIFTVVLALVVGGAAATAAYLACGIL